MGFIKETGVREVYFVACTCTSGAGAEADSISWNFGSVRRRGALVSPVQQQEAAKNAKTEARVAVSRRVMVGNSGGFKIRRVPVYGTSDFLGDSTSDQLFGGRDVS